MIFDCLENALLIRKSSRHGFNLAAFRLVQYYLLNGKQRISASIGNRALEWKLYLKFHKDQYWDRYYSMLFRQICFLS